MRLDPPARRMPPEPYLPLINIVFLLLIFFLIAARLAPAAPLPVTAPVAQGPTVAGDITLYLAADGRLAHRDAVGEATWAALASTRAAACAKPCATSPTLLLHVDAQASASNLGSVMTRLGSMGWCTVQLVTTAP
jgi:biopolymer transport protein ExbD